MRIVSKAAVIERHADVITSNISKHQWNNATLSIDYDKLFRHRLTTLPVTFWSRRKLGHGHKLICTILTLFNFRQEQPEQILYFSMRLLVLLFAFSFTFFPYFLAFHCTRGQPGMLMNEAVKCDCGRIYAWSILWQQRHGALVKGTKSVHCHVTPTIEIPEVENGEQLLGRFSLHCFLYCFCVPFTLIWEGLSSGAERQGDSICMLF